MKTFTSAWRQAKAFGWGLLTVVSGAIVLETGRRLTFGPFPIKGVLPLYYLGYSLAMVLLLHGIFFSVNQLRREKSGRTFGRNFPRYLEYAYAALLCLGLTQVYFQPKQFAEFVQFTGERDSELVERVKRQALAHLEHDCPGGGRYFPPSYCEKLRAIATSTALKEHLVRHVANDVAFLNHVIEVIVMPPQGVIERVSPISRDVDRLRAREEYGKFSEPVESSRMFNWIGFLLLPVGIALRVLKTSLELFGRLE